MRTTFSQRIYSARKMAGLSMDELASLSGLSKNAISRYEKGIMNPDSANLLRLAKALNLKVDYFFRKSSVELQGVAFRKIAKIASKSVESIKYRVIDRLEKYLELEEILMVDNEFVNPIANILIQKFEDVEQSAEQVREKWNLGLNPIASIIEMLEDNFIKVVEVNEPMEFDGLSTVIEGKVPVIVANQNFPVERKRFALLHELGHLLLSFDVKITPKEIEAACNRFAGAILVPKSKLISELGVSRKKIYVQELAEIEKEWGISIQASMCRVRDLNIISKSKLSQFYFECNTKPDFKKLVDESRYGSFETSYRFKQLLYKGLAQELVSMSKASVLSDQSINGLKTNLSLV